MQDSLSKTYIKQASTGNVTLTGLFLNELSEKGEGPNDYDLQGITLLHRTVSGDSEDHCDSLKAMLEHGADPNLPSRDEKLKGWTPLHFAVLKEKMKFLELLVEYGADVNKGNEYNDTPLHMAAYIGNAKVICTLLALGSDTRAVNNGGKTPLDLAVQEKHLEVVPLLSGTGQPQDTRVVRLGHSLCAILDKAKENGLFEADENVPTLNELDPIFEKASNDFSVVVMKQPPHLVETIMSHACRYLWYKAIEATFLWAQSTDGNVTLDIKIDEMVETRILTSLPAQLDEIVYSSSDDFQQYYKAHQRAMMRNQSTMTPEVFSKELTVALRYMPIIGVSYAMSKGYHEDN